jgi:hypothetical protein
MLRRPRVAGKFNVGQKLYANVLAGSVLVMIGTGLILWFPNLVPLMWRVQATFVHDWSALLLGALILGHIWMAAHDREARRGLRTGRVTREWARHHHPLWEQEHPAEAAPQKHELVRGGSEDRRGGPVSHPSAFTQTMTARAGWPRPGHPRSYGRANDGVMGDAPDLAVSRVLWATRRRNRQGPGIEPRPGASDQEGSERQ